MMALRNPCLPRTGPEQVLPSLPVRPLVAPLILRGGIGPVPSRFGRRNGRIQLHRQVRRPAPAGRGRQREDSDPQPGPGKSVQRLGSRRLPRTSPTRTGCDGRCGKPGFSTTPIGFGSGRHRKDRPLLGCKRLTRFHIALLAGKGQVEEILQDMGIPYAIIRAAAQLPRVAAIATGRMGGVNANLIMIAQ